MGHSRTDGNDSDAKSSWNEEECFKGWKMVEERRCGGW